MKNKEKDFDENIDFSEAGFNKQFKQISRQKRPNQAINKSLKEIKNRITIYLDADIVEYFKKSTEGTTIGYQTLINQTLREKIDEDKIDTKAERILEKLLQDKEVLSRLKSQLETV
jgi:uncharacterized protein (DUF4415 family)